MSYNLTEYVTNNIYRMLESFVSGLATCLTLGMFSTGIHTVQKIKRKGTGETPLLPFATQATA